MGISPAKDAALSTCHGWSRQRNKISGQAKGCTCTEPRTRLSGRDETVFCLSLFWPTLRVFAGQLFESAGAVVCESPSLVDLRAPSVDPHGRILPATVKRRPSPGPAARLSARPTLICAPYLSLSLSALLPCYLVCLCAGSTRSLLLALHGAHTYVTAHETLTRDTFQTSHSTARQCRRASNF